MIARLGSGIARSASRLSSSPSTTDSAAIGVGDLIAGLRRLAGQKSQARNAINTTPASTKLSQVRLWAAGELRTLAVVAGRPGGPPARPGRFRSPDRPAGVPRGSTP